MQQYQLCFMLCICFLVQDLKQLQGKLRFAMQKHQDMEATCSNKLHVNVDTSNIDCELGPVCSLPY